MSAVDVIDTQADLSEAMMGRAYGQYIAVAVHPVMGLLWDLPEGTGPDDLLRSEAARLRSAHSYHVNADMSALVHAAAVNLTADGATPLAFHAEDMPTEQGFAMFDGLEPDAVMALSWGPVTEKFTPDGNLASGKHPGVLKAGLRITSYTGRANHPRLVAAMEKSWTAMPDKLASLDAEVTRLLNTFEGLQQQAPDDTETLQRITQELAETRAMRTSVSDLVVWRERTQLSVADMIQWGRTVTPPKLTVTTSICVPRESTAPSGDARRDLAALAWTLFYFCRQTIAAVEEEAAHPRTAKRWRKLPLPKVTTVIRLRRSSTPRDGAPTAVEWSHRWLVRGHWRRQRVGPGRTEIRPVWVQGHVKGPEGAPLVVSNHVYDLVR